MNTFYVPQGRVAVEPFPATSKTEVRGGVLQPMNQSSLISLFVVFDGNAKDGPLSPGDKVHVRSKLAHTTTYAKDVFEIEGKKFILIPEEEVLVVELRDQPESF